MKKLLILLMLIVSVNVINAKPPADYVQACFFYYEQTFPQEIKFDPSCSHFVNPPGVYIFDYGDGSPADTSWGLSMFYHTYAQSGNYVVTLKVIDDYGNGIDNQVTLLCEVGEDPLASFSWNFGFPPDRTVASMDANQSSGENLKYKWDFTNDGTIDTITTSPLMTHDYEVPAQYQCKLIVEDTVRNISDDNINYLIVYNVPPVPFLDVDPTAGTILTKFVCDPTATGDPNSDPFTIDWDFDGDGNWDLVDQESVPVEYHFENWGNYNIRMKAVDMYGEESDVVSQAVIINNLPPVPVLTADVVEIFEGETVQFNGCQSYDPEGSTLHLEFTPFTIPVQYNGPTCSGGVWNVTYNTSGTYAARLRVADISGLWSDYVYLTITVRKKFVGPPGGGGATN